MEAERAAVSIGRRPGTDPDSTTQCIMPGTWILLLLALSLEVITCCELSSLQVSCDVTLAKGEKDKLFDEARRTVQCLVNNVRHQKDEFSADSTREKLQQRMRLFRCLIVEVQSLLSTAEQVSPVVELFSNWTDSDQHVQDNDCILCLLAQFRGTLTHDELWKTSQYFLVELREVEYIRKSVNVTQAMINPWVHQFLNLKNWANFWKTETSQLLGTYGAFAYGKRAEHSVIFDSMLNEMYQRNGGLPGVVAVGSVFVLGLVWNCVLLKIFFMHSETRNLLLINLTISNILTLVFNNFVAQFLGSSVYDLYTCLYVSLAIVGLNVYSVAMYSLHGFFSAQAAGPLCDFYKLYGARLLALGSWFVAIIAPARLLLVQVNVKSGHVYMLMIYVFIPLFVSVMFSHTKTKSGSISRGLAMVYVLTYFPLFVMSISSFYTRSQEHFIEPLLLIYMNAFLNPISLFITNGRFRQHFKRYLCCKTNGDLSYM